MNKYVVFLRGINVGGRIITMSDLKSCLESLGLNQVHTVLQTGNVVFESQINDKQKLKQLIETSLTQTFGYPAKVQIYTQSELATIVENYPFAIKNDDFQNYVIFLEKDKAKALIKAAVGLDMKVEETQVGKNVVYWRVRRGMTVKSPFSKNLVKPQFKEFNTVRNMNTLKKLLVI